MSLVHLEDVSGGPAEMLSVKQCSVTDINEIRVGICHLK